MKRLTIPEGLIPVTLDEAGAELFLTECLNLRRDLIAEFSSAEFSHRNHGLKTYMDGCRGPLCMQANRLYYRQKRGAEATDHWQIYDPILTVLAEQIQQEIAQAVVRARTEAFKSLSNTDLLPTGE